MSSSNNRPGNEIEHPTRLQVSFDSPAQTQPLPGYAPPAQFALQTRLDGLAIASFVCGLLGLALIPIILGHVALRRIRNDPMLHGSAFAIVGLVLGYLALVLWLLVLLLVFGSVFWALNS